MSGLISDGAGVYTLIVKVIKPITLHIGKLGSWTFSAGFYTYTGSALGKGALSLRGRVRRHLQREKKMRWHIDYLLNSEMIEIVSVVVAETSVPEECQVSQLLGESPNVKIVVKGFGSQDCRAGCLSHLHYFPKYRLSEIVEVILATYRNSGLSPTLLRI